MKLTPVASIPPAQNQGTVFFKLRGEFAAMYQQMEAGRWYLVEDFEAHATTVYMAARREGLECKTRTRRNEDGEKVMHLFVQKPGPAALEVVGASA